jgi:hypothetical protein
MNRLGSVMTNGNIYQFTNPLQVYSYNLIIILMQHGTDFTEVNNFQKIIETPLENQENYIAIKNESSLYAVYS